MNIFQQDDWGNPGVPEWANAVVKAPCGTQYYVEAWGVNSKRQEVGSDFICAVGADMTTEDNAWRLVSQRPVVWGGEGKPPAGTVCVLRIKREEPEGGWMDAEVMYSSKTAVVWRWEGRKEEFGAEWRDVEVRICRTPEQVAADKRKAAIDAMYRVFKDSPGLASQEGIAALYDAGYRKQVAP